MLHELSICPKCTHDVQKAIHVCCYVHELSAYRTRLLFLHFVFPHFVSVEDSPGLHLQCPEWCGSFGGFSPWPHQGSRTRPPVWQTLWKGRQAGFGDTKMAAFIQQSLISPPLSSSVSAFNLCAQGRLGGQRQPAQGGGRLQARRGDAPGG